MTLALLPVVVAATEAFPPPNPAPSTYQIAAAQYEAIVAAALPRRDMLCRKRDADILRLQGALAASVARLSAGDGPEVLLHAAAANRIPDVQRLLAAGANKSRSLMHAAAQFGDIPLLEVLANANIDIDGLSAEGTTPLMLAAGSDRTDNVAWLLRRGADVNARNPRGASVLFYGAACLDQELVHALIRAGAKVDDNVRRFASQRGLDVHTDASRALRRALEPPPGWHGPTPEELAGEPLRSRSPLKYAEAKADFDGDGKEDHSALFTADDGKLEGLFVKLSSRNAREWLLAAQVEHRVPSMGVGMGIAVANPGRYETACAKGYGRPCGPGDPTEVTLKQAGIDYFRFESAGSLVYWDGTAHEFRRVWTSE